nr:AAA family ATPase [Sphingomonas sp. TREG-RG-20F-R18-01]
MDAISAAVSVRFKGDDLHPIEFFDLADEDGLERLKDAVELAWQSAGPATPPSTENGDNVATDPYDVDEPVDLSAITIPEDGDLLGIDPAVYRQINAALRSGKQHLMFYGPPGTGKTSIARWVASSLSQEWTLITGSADWSSQDIIGGYQPIGGGEIGFVPGVLLKAFDQPLIIDELNRCDIDKVLGPLFTVLSGQESTLPYRVDVSDKDSPQYSILPRPATSVESYQFAPSHDWRLIATINSIDKAALYQMSYALTRRFGWIFVDVPADLTGFVRAYIQKTDLAKPGSTDASCPLGEIWTGVNAVRVIGPAPIIDMIKAMISLDPDIDFMTLPSSDQVVTYIDAISMFILPMLDGILAQEAEQIATAIINALGVEPTEAAAELIERLMRGAAV